MWEAFTGDFSALYNFNKLTKERLVEDAKRYSTEYANGSAMCFAAVECHNDTAVIFIVKDFEAWDIEETKKLVWARKFHGTCTGRVTNFAIIAENENLSKSVKSAFWRFSSDSFIPSLSRFSGGAIGGSSLTCMSEDAIIPSSASNSQ